MNSDKLEKQQFSGPNSQMLSHIQILQEGDQQIIPLSRESYSVEISPNNIIKGLIRKTAGTQRQSVMVGDEEFQYKSKPEFLRLLVAKSLQSNFINNLWNKTYLRKLHQLTPYQIQTLDDLDFDNTQNAQQDDQDVFTPHSKTIFLWDISQILLYLFLFFWLPFKLSFGMQSISTMWNGTEGQIVEILIIGIVSVDVIVGLNMAFIQRGTLIKNRKRIFKNYLRQYAFLVSIGTLAGQIFWQENDSTVLLIIQIGFCIIFYVLRLNKIDKILSSIYEFFNLNGQLNDLVALMQVITAILYIIHISACIWHGIAYLNFQSNWLDYYELRFTPYYTRYNNAIYWATMTMTTVGYGDITAKNNIETLVSSITMLTGSIVYAYSINSIGIFVSNIYKNKQEYTRSLSLINQYMQKNRIKFDLQTRVRSYLQYILTEEQQMNDEEVGTILNKLSGHLQEEMQSSLRGNILKKCQILTDSFSQQFQKHFISLMQEQGFSPEERIITLNQVDDSALYIITKGEVELTYEGISQSGDFMKRNSLKILKTGDYFGEFSFFTAKPRTASAFSKEFTRVYKIKRDHFLKYLHLYPSDLEKFCQIREQLIMGENVPHARQCFSCKSHNHLINECHFLHFLADKEGILKKELYPRDQNRSKYARRRFTSKLHPWINSFLLTRGAQKYYTLQKTDDSDEINSQEDLEENETPDEFAQSSQEVQYDSKNIITEEVQSPTKNRDNSLSINGTYKVNNTEENDKKFQKYIRNIVLQAKTIKTAGFGQLQKNETVKLKSESYINHQQEQISSKQLINTPIQPNFGDHGPNQKLSKKHISIKEEERSGTEQPQFTRQATKKKTKTRKENSVITEAIIHQSQIIDFEKMRLFTHYFPLNNYDTVLKRYARTQKQFGKKKIFPDFSLFSFFQIIIKKGFKLRRLGELGNKTNDPLSRVVFPQRKSHRKSKIPSILNLQ